MKKLFILSVAFMALFNLTISANTSTFESPVCGIADSNSDKTEVELVDKPEYTGGIGGRKRSMPHIRRASVDAWLQYGSLHFLNDEDIENMEVSIIDAEGNEMYFDYIDILAGEEAEINVNMLNSGSYTLEVTINGTVYSGCFNL